MSGVLVVGGYGAVGAQVSTILDAWAPGRIVAAGRRPDTSRLPSTVNTVHLDLADLPELERLIDVHRIAAVVLCVEPADAAAAELCLTRGVHLVDISATDGLLRQVERLADRAVANGVAGVLSVGLAPGLTNLLARRVHERVGGAQRIDITVLLGAGERHGDDALRWTVSRLAEPATIRPQRVALPGYGRRRAYWLDFADQHSLRRTLGVPAVRTRMCLDSVAATALLATLRRLGLLRTGTARRFAAAALSRVHIGGDGFAIRVDAVNGERRAALALTGKAQSRATAQVAAHVTRAAIAGALPAGVNHIDQLPVLAELPEDLEKHGIVVHDVPLGRP